MAAERLLTLPVPQDANLEVVEALFSDMCALPRSPNPLIYYSAILVDLCKIYDSRLALCLLNAVEKLYASANMLDTEVFDRITEWFSFHLSNFDFKWNWADWAACGKESARIRIPFKLIFCRDVLEHISRLSYRDHIRSSIPESLHNLLPPDPATIMNYDQDPNTERVLDLISGPDKRKADEVHARLIGIIGESEEREQLRCLFAAIFRAGSKTLTHFDAITERYVSVLSHLVASAGIEDGPLVILDELWKIWSAAPVRAIYCIDKLCAYRVMDVPSAVECLLSDKGLNKEELVAKLETTTLWEAARLLTDRQRSRLNTANQEVTNAARIAASATEGETEEAAARLQRGKDAVSAVQKEMEQLVYRTFRRLCSIQYRLTESVDDDFGPVWQWRVIGFCREMGRKHTDVLATTGSQLQDLMDSKDVTGKMVNELKALAKISTADLSMSIF
eukprot:Plantae.Rhodophyta-Purpureofilum_apyrenoidigerum.ctg12567.p1 GENE.Plantae.Rhodophyta-Purpureofilum_apyrenoidigerum.ctg12567~~Plantae.Rhodophyta-Purpureofilum_apyrenoidigerum.ctg12567.p1  ORF type:complete len:519 (-),score=86.04 Plantae.Rhodophyta-Purpureofilum_apyrenoidigerum.ctg12567:343-1689(-)